MHNRQIQNTGELVYYLDLSPDNSQMDLGNLDIVNDFADRVERRALMVNLDQASYTADFLR